ncbi:MAG: LytTR family DNA-binding domain-containing protein [Pseudomonadota bacterium]
MTLRVLIVDDEPLARSRLRAILSDCTAPKAVVAGEAAQAVEAMAHLTHQTVDVVLLDIQMPGMDGLALAQQLAALPQPPAVVFVTAHASHALQAFDINALDYLTKPVRLERLQQALQKVERSIKEPRRPSADFAENVLLIQDRGRTERLPLAEVLYLKAELKYVTVRTSAREYVLDGSLSELEQRYSGYFLRVHRNALVAKSALRALERHVDPVEGEHWTVRLSGLDERMAVSRRQLAAVREALAV